MALTALHEERKTMTITDESTSTASRARVVELVSGYLWQFDRPDAELVDAWYGSVFTDDVTLRFPVATHRGLMGIAALHDQIRAMWSGTLHTCSDPQTWPGEDGAVHFRVKVVAVHVHRDGTGETFHVGAVYEGTARGATVHGMSIESMTIAPVWTMGRPPERG